MKTAPSHAVRVALCMVLACCTGTALAQSTALLDLEFPAAPVRATPPPTHFSLLAQANPETLPAQTLPAE